MLIIIFLLGSGEFVVVNKHLLHDLTEMGVWSPVLKNNIIYQDGSVQKITEIPDDLKAIYKYVNMTILRRSFTGCRLICVLTFSIYLSQDRLGDQAENCC